MGLVPGAAGTVIQIIGPHDSGAQLVSWGYDI